MKCTMMKEDDDKTKEQAHHVESDFTKTEYHTYVVRFQYTILRCLSHISLSG